MKKILLIVLISIVFFSCKEDKPKNYVKLSGKIIHKDSDEISIKNMENTPIKTIKLSEDGSFSDTLVIQKGRYVFSDGHEYALLFLRPGDDIHMELDADKFDETLQFTGKGSKESSYIIKKLLKQEEVFNNINDLYEKPKDTFLTELERIKTDFQNMLKEQKDLDPDFIQSDIEDTDGLFAYLVNRYDKVSKINKMIGNPAPQFNYENHKGGKTSLSELKGKYVYIDVWATWCKPCLGEIPALKELEKDLGEKIHFVSISIDKENKHEAWKKMVNEKALKGIQLYADNNWDSQFVRDFGIDGIPRFIIIDPIGNVYKPDASRPSNPKTKQLLENLVK